MDLKETLDHLALLVSLEDLAQLVNRVLLVQLALKVLLASLDRKGKLETSVCKDPRVLPDQQVRLGHRDSEGHRVASDHRVLKVELGHRVKLVQQDIKDPWDHRAHLVQWEQLATLVMPETEDTTARLVLLELLGQQDPVVHKVARVSLDRLEPQVPLVHSDPQVPLVSQDLLGHLVQQGRKERRDPMVPRDRKVIQDIQDKEE